MATDPIRDYLEQRQALTVAIRQFEATIRTLKEATQYLEFRTHIFVPTPHESLPEVRAFDAVLTPASWPTLEHLTALFAAWEAAKARVQEVWQTIPVQDREHLIPPRP